MPEAIHRQMSPRAWILLGLILLAGTALRLHRLAENPFEQDELYTLAESRDLFQTRLQPGIDARPLYYLLHHALMPALPDTEAGARIPALAFGVLGLVLTWTLARSVFGTAGGLAATLLLAVSPWHIYASGMARYWSLVYLLSAAGLYFVLGALRTGERRSMAAGAASLAAAVASHPTALFPLVGWVPALLLVRDDGSFGLRLPTARELGWLWGPLAALLGMGAIALIATGREGAVQNWAGRGPGASLRLLPGMLQWMTPAIFASGAFGALWAVASQDAQRRRWGSVAVAGTAAALGLLLAASFRTDVYADYGMSFLPLVYVSAGGLVAMLAEAVQPRVRAGWAATAATLVLVAATLPGTASHLVDGTRFDYRPAFEAIHRAGPDRLTLAWPRVVQQRYAPDLRSAPLPDRPAVLDSLLAAGEQPWVVASYKRTGLASANGGAITEWLRRHCHVAGDWERTRLDFREYEVVLYDCNEP